MDKQRRKFLKTVLAVGAFFVVQKIVPPLFLQESAPARPVRPPRRKKTNETGDGITVIDGKKIVSVRDESGEEIFQIDNEA